MRVATSCSTFFAVVALAVSAAPGAQAQQAIITNGTVSLGVNAGGALNVPCMPSIPGGVIPGAATNPRCAAFFLGNTIPGAAGVGVMSNATLHEFTYDGCTCEGWAAGISGGAFNLVSDGQNTFTGPTTPANPVSFVFDATSATSVVDISTALRVTQFYHPSATPDLYQVDVTLTNLTGAVLGVGPSAIRYRREMDWDIEPTAFVEYSTIHGNGAANLLGTSDDGFAISNPFLARTQSGLCFGDNSPVDADFYHNGPCDHGALFDFGFPALGIGESRVFTIFYGVANNEATALADLALVSADDVYSFGQSNACANVPLQGGDNPCVAGEETAIFAFKGVGGHTVVGTPEPSTVLLLGTALVGMAGYARRRRRIDTTASHASHRSAA